MTVPIREGESWLTADGAPDGPHFDVQVASASEPGKTYRIVRQQDIPDVTDGYIVHSPACKAWEFGHRECRHVRRAVELAEEPELTFLNDARERWEQMGGALATGDDLVRFWADTHADLIAARERRAMHLRIASARAQWASLPPEERTAAAVAEFSGGAS